MVAWWIVGGWKTFSLPFLWTVQRQLLTNLLNAMLTCVDKRVEITKFSQELPYFLWFVRENKVFATQASKLKKNNMGRSFWHVIRRHTVSGIRIKNYANWRKLASYKFAFFYRIQLAHILTNSFLWAKRYYLALFKSSSKPPHPTLPINFKAPEAHFKQLIS